MVVKIVQHKSIFDFSHFDSFRFLDIRTANKIEKTRMEIKIIVIVRIFICPKTGKESCLTKANVFCVSRISFIIFRFLDKTLIKIKINNKGKYTIHTDQDSNALKNPFVPFS